MPTFLPPALLGVAIVLVGLSPLSTARTRARMRAYIPTREATRYAVLVTLFSDCTVVGLVLVIIGVVPGMTPLPLPWHWVLWFLGSGLLVAGTFFLAYALNLRQSIGLDRR